MTHLTVLFIGWQNPAALSYPSYPNSATAQPNTLPPGLPPFRNSLQMPPLPGSNLNNQISGVNLSYGFAPHITACQIPNERHSAGYPPSIPQMGGIGMNKPQIGWAMQGFTTTDGPTHTPAVDDGGIEKQVEVPCHRTIVPDDELPIYSFGYPTVSNVECRRCCRVEDSSLVINFVIIK